MDLALQRELLSEALDEIDVNGDLTNQILEVTLEESEAGRSYATVIPARLAHPPTAEIKMIQSNDVKATQCPAPAGR